MNLRSLDLNLLVVFDAIFKEKSITKAGQRIGLSQPAMSNALTRLRGHLSDELFLRGTDSLRPTPRAIELSVPIHAILAELEQVLEPAIFDPKQARRVFTVATADYFSLKVAPKLVVYLEKNAPGIDVRFVPTALNAIELLDRGEIDVGVFGYKNPPERFGTRTLFRDTFSCMMAANHPLAQRDLTLKRYASARHLVISLNGDPFGIIDQLLAEGGLTRRVIMTINQFSVASTIIESTDLIVTAPTKILEDCLSEATRIMPCPVRLPVPHGHVDMLWHKRLGSHPAHVWFRDTLAKMALSGAETVGDRTGASSR
jgi:DNA-binding transcriptional LysR family regulator